MLSATKPLILRLRFLNWKTDRKFSLCGVINENCWILNTDSGGIKLKQIAPVWGKCMMMSCIQTDTSQAFHSFCNTLISSLCWSFIHFVVTFSRPELKLDSVWATRTQQLQVSCSETFSMDLFWRPVVHVLEATEPSHAFWLLFPQKTMILTHINPLEALLFAQQWLHLFFPKAL